MIWFWTERFLYNKKTNNLFNYHIDYDDKTLDLIHPYRIIKQLKKSIKKQEARENFRKISDALTEFVEICKEENDMSKRKEMVSQLLKQINDFIKKNINNNLLSK